MSRIQFHLLNLTSLALVVLMVMQMILNQGIRSLSSKIYQIEATIANARQVEPVLNQVTVFIAQASDSDVRFRDLLVKHALKVTLTSPDGKQKNYP